MKNHTFAFALLLQVAAILCEPSGFCSLKEDVWNLLGQQAPGARPKLS